MLLDPKWNKPLVDQSGLELLKAAEYIEKNGWCQGTYANRRGGVCIVGALIYSGADINYGKERSETWQKLHASLRMLPHIWNDHICQNKKQAIEALRKAAFHELP